MNKEEIKNNNFNIEAKYEDMILRAERIVEHHLFVSDGSCEPPSYISLAYDVKNYLPNLQQENKQLREENEELKSKMKQASEMLNHPWTFESGNKEVDEETHRRKLEIMKLLWEEENE